LIWEDDHWTVHNPVQCWLPGTLWLASKTHYESVADMTADQAEIDAIGEKIAAALVA
jgi:hypothetical protein